MRSSVTIHLPAGYRASELPKEQAIDDAFRQARSSWKAAGDGTLAFELTVSRKAGSYPADTYSAYVQSAQQIVDALQTHLVLQKAEK